MLAKPRVWLCPDIRDMRHLFALCQVEKIWNTKLALCALPGCSYSPARHKIIAAGRPSQSSAAWAMGTTASTPASRLAGSRSLPPSVIVCRAELR